jgi:predicted PhzF superfamily epimerase YddE/YHI9
VHYRVVGGDRSVVHIENEQGYELGRPSQIFIDVERRGSIISRVRVGGRVVKVMEGTIWLEKLPLGPVGDGSSKPSNL